MNGADVSDLEEGEILEYDSVPSSCSRGDFGARNWSLESSIKTSKNGRSGLKENKGLFLSDERKDGYINVKLREKLNVNEKGRENKSNVSLADLESISSEGEYISDECEDEYYKFNNGEMSRRKKQSSHFYGAVEDIMSEIGETICRKSRCNYKKRKSKELKQNLDKCSNNTYDLWRREIFSSHLKSKKHNRKGSFYDSDSDLGKYRIEKRKKRKKREVSYEEEETAAKKLKLRDFDEMRRNLLEKLKKQKAEEELKESIRETPLELENSEIQEIDMLVDCTNYVDNPPAERPDSANERTAEGEKEGEDELDLIKLRLIALASNKKRKVVEDTSNTEKPEDYLAGKEPACRREEVDLDRNELLLRAKALKTALLKKHQKRLNKLKARKPAEIGSCSVNEGNSSSPAAECADLEREKIGKLDADACKENVERESERERICSDVHAASHSHVEVETNTGSGSAVASNGNSKKSHSKVKGKRKKRKSLSFANNLKENNEKSETLDEDDSTLRSQLLSDLMRKKSLKDQEKKSVLLDSVQTAANKPSPSTALAEPPKDNLKPSSGVKKNLLKKINAPKSLKPAVVPKFPKPDIQRIIVHLGSEDSSDEDGCPPSQEESKRSATASAESTGASTQAAEVIQAEYERSVEQLLSRARRKVEGEKGLSAKTAATPEAVYKHLPPSQRLEYIRLKQKIAERESLKKQKNENPSSSILSASALQPLQTFAAKKEEPVESVSLKPQIGSGEQSNTKLSNSSSDNGASHKSVPNAFKPAVFKNTSSGSKSVGAFPSSSGAQTKQTSRRLVSNKMKNNLIGFHVNSLNSPAAAPENCLKTTALAERNFLLLPSSQALLSKLKLLLKKIKVEKMIEEIYEKEISKLKNQLGLFEKKKCERRFKIKKLWEESMKTYKAIQGITAKAKGKPAPKESGSAEQKTAEGQRSAVEGRKAEEVEAKEVEEGKKVSDETETQISQAQSKSDKELDSDGKINGNVTDSTSSDPCRMKYDSPLHVFSKVSDYSTRVDPNVMVCQFDLMGVCKDEECTYQHLRF